MNSAPRKTVAFTVELAKKTWLGIDGKPTTKEAAALFVLNRTATMAERARIEMRVHVEAGGIAAWQDLCIGLDHLRSRLRSDVMAKVWPDGPPDPITPEDEKRFEVAWLEESSATRDQWRALQGLHDRLRLAASWPTLAVSVPTGWEDLGAREDDEAVLGAIVDAYQEALAETDAGKAQPSAS